MVNIKVICVGKLKERFYRDACAEYLKRLTPFCKLELEELSEVRRPADPSPAETAAALNAEGEAILARVPKGARLAALCIEGDQPDSPEFSAILEDAAQSGGRLCFVIGSSDGLAEGVKQAADLRVSMSRMTFPHHLARVMLLEQIYRGFQISAGGKYHK